ncbi:MAG: hypothetical protein RJA57_49, partial [Bacteroidota bacterium]
MPFRIPIFTNLLISCLAFSGAGQDIDLQQIEFEFLGNRIELVPGPVAKTLYSDDCGKAGVLDFASRLPSDTQNLLIEQLRNLRHELNLNDWLFYQLIRRTAQALCPKSDHYYRYTVLKWWMLVHTGYDARLRYGQDKLLFYVQTDDAIFEIPVFRWQNRNFVCLNYHDYANRIDFDRESFELLPLKVPTEGSHPFSYRINRLPSLGAGSYQERKL